MVCSSNASYMREHDVKGTAKHWSPMTSVLIKQAAVAQLAEDNASSALAWHQ